jgi:hypothetical protein
MSLIDKAVTHFSSKGLRKIEIPEWETELYAKNLTLEDRAKWLSRADGDTTDYMVYAVIFGLTDKEGNAVFDVGDKIKLRRNVDPDIVTRLANFVLLVSGESEEDREKN